MNHCIESRDGFGSWSLGTSLKLTADIVSNNYLKSDHNYVHQLDKAKIISECPPYLLDDDQPEIETGTNSILSSKQASEQFGVKLVEDNREHDDDLIDINGGNIVPDITDNTAIYGQYFKGLVVSSDPDAIKCLADDYAHCPHTFATETTGIITDELTQGNDTLFEENRNFMEIRQLGRGSYGEVSLNKTMLTKSDFVTKKIFNGFDKGEIDALQMLKHNNIVSLRGFIVRNGRAEILLEYAGECLSNYVKRGVDDRTIIEIMSQALSAFIHLDERKILNPDVKPDNFCIMDMGHTVKLTMVDLGSCQMLTGDVRFDVGWTPEYMSPDAAALFLSKKGYMPDNVIREKYGITTLDGRYHVYVLGLIVFYLKTKQNILEYVASNGNGYNGFTIKEVNCMQGNLLMYMAQNPPFMKEFIKEIWIPPLKGSLHVMLEGIPGNRPTASIANNILSGLTSLYYGHSDSDESSKLRGAKSKLFHKIINKQSSPYARLSEKDMPNTKQSKPDHHQQNIPLFDKLM